MSPSPGCRGASPVTSPQPIARLTEPFLLCHVKPSSCRVCACVPLELQPEMKYKSQFARLCDGWRRRAAQINNQIHVPANTNTGITATAPSQLELISAFFFFFFPPPRLDRQRDRWFSLLRHGLFVFFDFPLPPARPPSPPVHGQNYLTSSVFYRTVGSGSGLSVLPVPL